MARRPNVSVVLPVYNEGELLLSAAASVLDQSYESIELLIVDDGSDRDLRPVLAPLLQDSRVEVFRHEQNRGAAAARNTGIRQAQGDYIAFLDSDDLWHHEKLERQLAFMADEAATPVSCTAFQIITPFRPKGELRQPQPKIRFNDLLWGCSISPGSTMLAKRALFERIGPFEESLRRLEDWDWLLRCAQVTPIAVVPEVLAVVRTGLRELYPMSALRDAANILTERASSSGKYALEGRQKRIFLSTLHTEIAAAAFLRRHYRAAVGSFLTAFYYHPIKRAEYYRRILRAILIDLTRGR